MTEIPLSYQPQHFWIFSLLYSGIVAWFLILRENFFSATSFESFEFYRQKFPFNSRFFAPCVSFDPSQGLITKLYVCNFKSASIFSIGSLFLAIIQFQAIDKSSYDPANFKVFRLKSSDPIRFLSSYKTVNQEIATHGASQFVQVGHRSIGQQHRTSFWGLSCCIHYAIGLLNNPP